MRSMRTSVVIPTKNNAATIGQCLASLIPYYEQGYISEIVVVDAHSIDGTLEIVNKFPTKVLFDEGVSPYLARELGWRNTSGELVLFTDADTYLGKDFFPAIYRFFEDPQIGIVGVWERAVLTNRIGRTIGEWWIYHANNLRKLLYSNPNSWSLFQRLYHRVVFGGEKCVTTSGPCFIVRRDCLEAVGGFECPQGSADVLLSKRIIDKGWKATWWLEAPLYHYPPTSLRQLIGQRRRWGKTDAVIHKGSLEAYQKAILVIARFGTPIIGLMLALRFKNPLHLLLFPLAHYAWIAGYLAGLLTPSDCTRTPSSLASLRG